VSLKHVHTLLAVRSLSHLLDATHERMGAFPFLLLEATVRVLCRLLTRLLWAKASRGSSRWDLKADIAVELILTQAVRHEAKSFWG